MLSVDPYDLPPHGIQAMEGGAVCLTCGKTFKHAGNATRHFKEVHLAVPGKRYDCHICGRSFPHARRRNEHWSRDHNIKKLRGKPTVPSVTVEDDDVIPEPVEYS